MHVACLAFDQWTRSITKQVYILPSHPLCSALEETLWEVDEDGSTRNDSNKAQACVGSIFFLALMELSRTSTCH